MMRWVQWVVAIISLPACIYVNRDGEFSAGAVDPVNFPPPYLGVGGDRSRPGNGVFNEVTVYAHGQAGGAFFFPLSTTQTAMGTDPLRVLEAGRPYDKVPTPFAYVFDPEPPNNPFPASSRCTPEADYTYNARRDEVDFSQQGNVFSVLPTASYPPGRSATWSYVPVVAQVPVRTVDLACQSIKSESTLLASQGVQVPAQADGLYLAWAMIDPAAQVYRVGESINNSFGYSLQRFGWFNHFAVVYLDGGYVPTQAANVSGADVVRMVPQRLYHPRSMVGSGSSASAGQQGRGYDVITALRDEAGYSPLCEVFTYDAGATLAAANLPRDEAAIMTMFGATLQPASTRYVFCLQVR